jgi:hypothetical protein
MSKSSKAVLEPAYLPVPKPTEPAGIWDRQAEAIYSCFSTVIKNRLFGEYGCIAAVMGLSISMINVQSINARTATQVRLVRDLSAKFHPHSII